MISKRGRLSGAGVFQQILWARGHPVEYAVAERIFVLRSATPARRHLTIGLFGQVYVPTAVQHAVGISPRDNLLLVACPTSGVVIVLPPDTVRAALSPVLAQFQVSA